MRRERRERWMVWAGPWSLWLVAACQEPNPDFDGPAEAGNDTGSTSTGTATGTGSTGPVATGDGTSSGSSGEPPGTSSGEPPGTSSGEPGGSTTEACMGMICNDVCIDPMTDPDHCGECDNNCVGQQECIEGECMVP